MLHPCVCIPLLVQCVKVHMQSGRTTAFDVTQARGTLLAIRETTKAFAAQQAESSIVPECEEARARLLAKAKVNTKPKPRPLAGIEICTANQYDDP